VGRYLAGRLAALLPTLLLVSALAFALTQLAGGDPARQAAEQGGDLAPEEVVKTLRERWGLNDALPVRYVRWLGRVVQGDLGQSYLSGRPVAKELWNKYPATLLLAIAALLVSAAAGIPLGLLSAQKRDSWLDHLARVGAVAVAAVPGFWLGLLLIVLFGEYLGWLPTGGFGVDHHVILPALALGALPTVTVMRLTRSSFLEAQDLDYVRTARAKGLGESAVAWGHVLPNALVPTITYLGLHFGNLLGGAVVIEAIFAWPGAGQVVLQSISGRDMPVIAGYVLVSALIYVTVNLLVDVAYVILDPRVRLK
jgi:peptide/nickel transport system permease protein